MIRLFGVNDVQNGSSEADVDNVDNDDPGNAIQCLGESPVLSEWNPVALNG